CQAHAVVRAAFAQDPFGRLAERPASHEQKAHPRGFRQQRDDLRQLDHAVPRSEGADKASEYLIAPDAQVIAYAFAADVRPETIDIHAVRVNHDFLVINANAKQIPPFNFGNDKDARRRLQIQTLVTFQQAKHSDAVPVTADPNFRAVVFKK